ncbi:hypothetical protein GUITHDRAFT_119094 [Guillardia theta CCMP2712]|uniref:Uncharacterized protein n=1 Tax=Guillardia theta (strain CCMP2712) TaxID=905079 RepID=L1IEZ4_GUITC|nr:hypothetical protein GUITHDRAFT_119094 [Guillardia theta CCMP2712]EKX34783.1 hypothetical protein GUITHDRAFT_119094 [Guillardia theta CCMP2712]|eukprot:XP_005821763.1 hypothetical protein GUITHDRAFT_119094 [Guillardia theta CCMP2712]
MWHTHKAAVEAAVPNREHDLLKDHLIFDTSSEQGKRELAKEAIAAINGDAKLRERLGGAEGRRAMELKKMIEHYQTLIGRHNGNIIATIQTGAEGQERLDLAGLATEDMMKRLKDFSSNAGRLRNSVEELRKATRPLELAEASITGGIGCIEALSTLVSSVRKMQELHIASSSKAEYYKQINDCVITCKEAWSKLQVAGKHPKLAAVKKAMKECFATVSVSCRSEFKAAQQAASKEHGQQVLAFTFVVTKESEVDLLFPHDWGVARQLLRKILREAEQTLLLKLSEFEGLRLKMNYYELTKVRLVMMMMMMMMMMTTTTMTMTMTMTMMTMEEMMEMTMMMEDEVTVMTVIVIVIVAEIMMQKLGQKMESVAKEFEQEADKRWAISRPVAEDDEAEKASLHELQQADHCLSRRFTEFFKSHPELKSQTSSSTANKPEGEAERGSGSREQHREGEEGNKDFIAVFTLEELDDNVQEKDEQRDVLMVEEEIEEGGDYISLDRWSRGLKILQADLSLWVMVNMEVSRRAHKAMLQMLDAPNRQTGRQHGAKKDKGTERSGQHDKTLGQQPFSLRYRLQLLLSHREEGWQDFAILDQTVSFKTWRSSQLRLILSVVQVALKPGARPEEETRMGSEEAASESVAMSEERWRVMEEAREFTSPQLLHAITRLTEEINQTEAPSSDLWNKYCEAHYMRAVRRLKNHVLSVLERRPWADTYGVLSILMYEKLVAVGCFDPMSGSLLCTWGESRAGQGRAGQGRAGQGRAEQSRAEQSRAGQGRAEQSRAEQGQGDGDAADVERSDGPA